MLKLLHGIDPWSRCEICVALFVTMDPGRLEAGCHCFLIIVRLMNCIWLGENLGGLCYWVWAHSRNMTKWLVKYKTTSAETPFWTPCFWDVLCHIGGSLSTGHPKEESMPNFSGSLSVNIHVIHILTLTELLQCILFLNKL